MNVLTTGAAGYIGSIVTDELIKEGHSVIALDNLEQGHREAVVPQALFIQADLGDSDKLNQIFMNNKIEAVMHLAAVTEVAESISDPGKYFQTNLVYSINLLRTMLNYDVNKLVFSSSAAVYGNPKGIPIKENAPTVPVNPYGESKLMFEKILHWYGNACNLNFISLRYFNAAGASGSFGEDHEPETHLIPNILKVALGHCDCVTVFGTDYPTEDGSCIRDYIHVLDIAKAHIQALKHLSSKKINKAYNLGNGMGFSVFEVIETASKVTGFRIPVVNHPRRQGDPPALIAGSILAKEELGWEPEYCRLETIIQSAWEWQWDNPKGCSDMESGEAVRYRPGSCGPDHSRRFRAKGSYHYRDRYRSRESKTD